MRRIPYRSFCCIAVSMLLFCVLRGIPAKAYEVMINQIIYSSTEQTVTVTGGLGEELAGRDAVITIFRPGKTIADLTASNAKEIIAFTAQTTAGSDGSFAFKAGIEGETGEYGIVITTKGAQSGTGAFTHIDPQDVVKALDELRAADDVSAMEEKLTGYAWLLELDLSEFHTFGSELKTGILNRLIQNDQFTTAEELRNLFKEIVITEQFNFAENENAVKLLIEKYKSEIGISDLNIYHVTYARKLGDELQTAAAKAMLSERYESLEAIKTSFVHHVILGSIKNTASWIKINPLLSGNSGVMGIDLSAYEALSDTSAVDKKLVGIEFQSFEALEAAVKQAIDSIRNSTAGSGGSGGGGGSGSGGGGGSSSGFGTAVNKPAAGIIEIKPAAETKIPEKKSSFFSDLDSVPWAVESIDALAEKRVLSGRENGLFFPDESVTRAEFVKMLVLAFDLYEPNAEAPFTDIPQDAWYSSYAANAWEWGIAEGTSDGEFLGEDEITRQDMAVMIFRAWGILDDKISKRHGETRFDDSDEISEYAANAVSVMADREIINGTGDNLFSPKDRATRAAAAKMIDLTMRCIQEGEMIDEM